jgi:general secretion pathway protein K
MPNTHHRNNSNRGYAIVAAIWLAGLALAAAAEFSLVMRNSVLVSANRLRTAELAAISGGAVNLAAWQAATETNLKLNGEPKICAWNDDVTLSIALQDHGGLLDINLAPAQLLEQVFIQLDVPNKKAGNLTQDIINYRDVDTNTAQGQQELLLRDGSVSKNAPFETVEELDLMPSMDDDLYWRLKPYFTVLSAQPSVDPETMPMELQEIFSKIQNAETYFIRSQRRAIRIRVAAVNKSGVTHATKADIIIQQQPNQPFQVTSWNQTAQLSEIKRTQAPLAPCFNSGS